MKFPHLLLAAAFAGSAVPAHPAPEGVAFFEQKIRPLLAEHCYECHSAGAKKLKGNLYLDTKAGWEKGGDSGAAVIVPGQPEASLLIRSVQHLEPDLEMPPKKAKLSGDALADLVTWVKMGAPDPRDGAGVEAKRADKSWWSLQPLARASAPDSIDGFIDAQLRARQLTQNPPADPRALLRRMTYDLTGLPPTPAEVEEFSRAHEEDPQRATEAAVDRLLASPRYGEHWGRHWLDVVRFGESNGFERNFVIDDLWPFRDYVIRSLNDDKPFDQFIVEHLAGDVVGREKPEVEVGSAFLVAGPYDDVGNQDVVAQKNIRAATLDDMITATGSAFLGLTVNCARCHHHKFDPIPTEDYYRLRAAFEGVTHGRRVVATKAERAAFAAATRPLQQEKAALTKERDALAAAIESRAKAEFDQQVFPRPKVDSHGTTETFPETPAKFVRFTIHALTGEAGGKAPRNGRLTEFQVWSSEERNVALASNGARADGARGAVAEDFPDAYGPQLCIDGQLGEQWFIGTPAQLTLTLPRQETIHRVVFISSKGRDIDDSKVRGSNPCEYTIEVSLDGQTWKAVASSEGREPWTPAHGIARMREKMTTPEEAERLAALDRELARVQASLTGITPLQQIWVGNHAQPKELTYVQKGGDPMKPAAAIAPASLSVLDQVAEPFELKPDAPQGERRLRLAQWITSTSNPLTPRVLANRVWHYHFGVGLVDTPSDFGFLGSKPTHPELLDFLARRLLAHGWRLKPLHREIMLSRAYRQSAAFRPEAARVDKDARLLWRFPPRRLSAEEVRDTILSVSGKLQLEPMGGRGFRLYKVAQNNVSTYFPLDQHGPDTYRRAVYHQNARASVVDVLSDFDLPDIAFAAPKRANTTTPMQALTMLNHSFTLDMAAALAERAGSEDPVGRAYALSFQRSPTAAEREAGQKFIAAHGARAFARALLNASELLYLD